MALWNLESDIILNRKLLLYTNYEIYFISFRRLCEQYRNWVVFVSGFRYTTRKAEFYYAGGRAS